MITEIQSHGVENYAVDDTGKHMKLRFRWNGQQLMQVYPRSPSDSQRGLLNCLSDLRKQMGVKRDIKKSAAPKRRTRRHATVAPLPTTITVKADPFAVLAKLKKEKRRCPKMSLAEAAAMLNSAPP